MYSAQERIRTQHKFQQELSNQQGGQYAFIYFAQAVQAAVDHQLTTLVGAHPSYRVALVTFNDEVGHGLVLHTSFKHTQTRTSFFLYEGESDW